MDKFIPKQSAGCVSKRLLWMSYKALNAKNKKYFYWKKFKESKLHADFITYKKYKNGAMAEI